MRARSIKPGICDNELLGTADPFCTLLFERLWMMADREGRLEDRPLRIKAQAFPYREGIDIHPLLNWLAEQGFVRRYTVSGIGYIQVAKFTEHQSPHIKEAPSKIPAPDSPGASPSLAPVQALPKPAPAALTPSSLTPDSGLLTADSGSLRSRDTSASATPEHVDEPEWFSEFKSVYPPRAGDQGWRKAMKAGQARIGEGHSPVDLLDGARRYAEFCRSTQKIGTEFVKQAATFLGPDKPFLQPWHMPSTKADIRLAGNLTAAQEFMRRTEPQ